MINVMRPIKYGVRGVLEDLYIYTMLRKFIINRMLTERHQDIYDAGMGFTYMMVLLKEEGNV